MAQNVVGTFATMADAESAVQALRELGISDDAMTVVPHTADQEDAEATTALAQSAAATAELEGRQVPEAVVEVAAHGPKREGGYIIVRAESDELAAQATQIMERYQAVDLESRGQQYQPGDWNHVDDPAALATGDADPTQSSSAEATASALADAPLLNPINNDTTAQPGSDAVVAPALGRRSRVYPVSAAVLPAEPLPSTSSLSGATAPTPDMPEPSPVIDSGSQPASTNTFAPTQGKTGAGLGQQMDQQGAGGLLAVLQRPLAMLLIGVALGFALAQLFKKEQAQ